MPVDKHLARDYTGRACLVFDGLDWQAATVTGPERIARVPYFAMSGYREVPITPVRLSDGRETEAGCLALRWVDSEWCKWPGMCLVRAGNVPEDKLRVAIRATAEVRGQYPNAPIDAYLSDSGEVRIIHDNGEILAKG